MRLHKIDIFGFKTFPEKTTIHFKPGIICIVGPNGCGKSNVVDAILWVMGEQSVKSLRSEKMEDVIFSGSETRRGLGMAEVTLTISDIRGGLSAKYAEYSQIEITRRLFRSGESEYLINKVPSRLKDIRDLLIDAGIGFKGHTVIEQGKIERLLTSTPEDRRSIIEDTAGIMKFKTRKAETLRKLEATRHNLLRVRDIIYEVKRQINSLERQVKRAKDYQELINKIKDIEVTLYAIKYRQLDSKLKEIHKKEEDLNTHEMRIRTELACQESEVENIKAHIVEMDSLLKNLREERLMVEKELSKCESKILLLNNQLTHLEEERARLTHEINMLQEERKKLNASQGFMRSEKEKIEEKIKAAETRLSEEERLFELTSRDFHDLQERLEEARTEVFSIVGKITDLKNLQTSTESRLSELQRIGERILKEKGEGSILLEEIRHKVSLIKGGRRSWEKKLSEQKATIVAHSERLTAIEDRFTGLTEELNHKKERLHRQEARYYSLEEMEKNYAGYEEGVRSILISRERKDVPFTGIHGILADFIDTISECDIDVERAIESYLSNILQNIVVENTGEVRRAIDFLKSSAGGRATFISKKALIPLSKDDPLPPPMEGIIGPAISFVRCLKEGYEELLESVLSDVLVVDNLDTAIEIITKNNIAYTMVTLDGEIVRPDGRITGGISGRKSQGVLKTRKELKHLRQEISILKETVSGLEGKMERLKEERNRLLGSIDSLKKETQQTEFSLINMEKEIERLSEEEKRLEFRLATLEREEEEIGRDRKRLEEEASKCGTTISTLEQERKEKEMEIQRLIEIQKAGREEWERKHQELTTSKLELTSLREKRESIETQLTDMERRTDGIKKTIIEKGNLLNGLKSRKEELLEEKRSIEINLETLFRKKDDLSKDILNREEERKKMEEVVSVRDKTIKGKRDVIDHIKKNLNELEVEKTEVRMEMQYIHQNMYDAYGLYMEEEVTRIDSQSLYMEEMEDMEGMEMTLQKLKEKQNRMGSVNMASIEEYEELSQRHGFLTRQEADLIEACDTLTRTISKINKTTREMFLNTFNTVNEKFQYLFKLFFQGGEARLVLTDESRILESGIDIVARPPGKKINQLALLSGGEKALTSLSLLFATFLARPTPFCILDEIDAPLDESNTDRFINILKDMTNFSQFIIVTHNRRTMEAADVLYGITMEEPGVSKIVSVDLSKREDIPVVDEEKIPSPSAV